VSDDRYFEPDVELMPRADIEALQEERILELVPYAYERSALYRTVWDEAGVHPRDIKSMADFNERIPVINKDVVRAFRDKHDDPYGGLLCVEPSELTAIMSSSGTTGDATFFPERFDTWAPLATSYVRDYWETGLRPGDHTLPPSVTFRGSGYHTDRLAGTIPLAFNTWIGNWEGLFEVIARYQVRYCQWLGPVVAEIDRLGSKYDLREVFAPLKAASFAGEPLGARTKAKIRDEWGVELFMWTSAADTGSSWECGEHDGYHLWEDHAVFEALDPLSRQAVPEGDIGELVATDIDNLVAPLIRYGSEDLVRLSYQTCGCGRTHARQWPTGRAGDLTVVQGVGVMPMEVWSVIEQQDETSAAIFQIIRPAREVDRLRIRVGYDEPGTTDVGELRERLEQSLLETIGVRPELELVPEGEIIARSSSAAKIPRVAKS
jgi:phenylacetate-CoA ligase